MWNWGVNPLVIPNGLSADSCEPPEREAVAAFRERLRGRTVVSKVARWHPDKHWMLAIDTVGAMKRLGWQPLLIARGGVETHGAEVLATAAAAGLRVVARPLLRRGVRGLLQALEGMQAVDVASLTSPVDADSLAVLFHSSAAVLANSGHEPFGLVGLETMAVGGVACTGCSGEDYAVPGHNALVLETVDPQEFIDLFGELRANPAQERAMRRAGRATAKQYTWSRIMQRILLPRLRLMYGASVPSAGDDPVVFTRGTRMHIHIEGKHTQITPHLLGWIAERLEDLNMPHEDIIHARVTLVKHRDWQRDREEARIELQLVRQILDAAQTAKTAYDALYAALKTVGRKLDDYRTLVGRGKTPLKSEASRSAAPSAQVQP
jgi:ribosome-associated translation inhibitor RaiA